jgi:hypothetical protein
MSSADNRPVGGAKAFPRLRSTVLERVSRRFSWLDPMQIEDAVDKAILRRVAKDGDFWRDVAEGREESLVQALYHAACRCVGNSVRKEKRRCQREQKYARRKKIEVEEGFFVASGLSAENIRVKDRLDELEQLLEGCHPWERAIVMLRKEGCKDWKAQAAEVLGVAQLPIGEQRRAVKREWDRLLKKLQRRAKRLGFRPS